MQYDVYKQWFRNVFIDILIIEGNRCTTVALVVLKIYTVAAVNADRRHTKIFVRTSLKINNYKIRVNVNETCPREIKENYSNRLSLIFGFLRPVYKCV